MWLQKNILLKPKSRGFHLVTCELLNQLPELDRYKVGILHLLIQHTSASLSINENADPDVRRDLDEHLNCLVPDGAGHFIHVQEGPDDMPAHIKTGLMGVSLGIPIAQGKLALGTWQGIYLGEHREHASARHVVATLQGELQKC